MIAAIAAALLSVTPLTHLQITTTRGVTSVPLLRVRGEGPLVPLNTLARSIGGTVARNYAWITLQTADGNFQFLAGTALVLDGITMRGMPAASHLRGDSLWVPLAFVANVLASPGRQSWTFAPNTGVLRENPGGITVAGRTNGKSATPGVTEHTHAAGTHHVTIDPGHGGTDTGNPGMFFPRGMTEKDVTLKVGLLVRDELERRGVRVTMTRTTDTLINLGQRAPRYCTGDCDLFVSIHVNSLNPRPGYQQVRGFETYFLSEARDEDAARVARMENGAQRFDNPDSSAPNSGLDFMFKDLQRGEYLRGSQQAAAFIQSFLSEVHDGGNKGVKQAGFAVLNTARRPSVLIEIGFATNRADAALMTSAEGQRNLASYIALAIQAYLKQHDREVADTPGGNE